MKTLLILRHGKAENRGKAMEATDHPRTLTERGRLEAEAQGRAVTRRGVPLDLIVSSDARRAYQTATLAAAELAQPAPILIDPAIYHANGDLDGLLEVVRRLPGTAASAMIVGHNPGLEDLAAALTGQTVTLPTGGLACVTLPVEGWRQVREGAGTLAWVETPDPQ
jgi:phosphohistidine phosphatase